MQQWKNKQPNFKGQQFFVGIDVHSKNWAVTIRTNNNHLKTLSMNPSPEALHQYMTKHYPNGEFNSVYEAGFCGFWIHRSLTNLGFNNVVINPADVPTTHKEKHRRCDTVDSAKLSRELADGALKAIYTPDPFHEQLRSLTRLYCKSVKHRTRIKNRIRGFLNQYGVKIPARSELFPWSGRFLQWLSTIEFEYEPANAYLKFCFEELIQTRQRTKDIIHQLRVYSKESPIKEIVHDYLMSIPGIGFITAIIFYSEIIDMKRFHKFDHLASFVGLVPDVDASGDRETIKGLTFRRNRYLRHMIVEAAWIAIGKDPALTLQFQELTKRMTKQKAIVRIAKKLLSRMRYVWMNEIPYVLSVV